MNNAVEKAFTGDDDEEGVAESAASLGADGGPVVAVEGSVEEFDSDLDDINDESWLDEELSDEELAALGEEDFDLSEFTDEELAAELGEDFTDVDVAPEPVAEVDDADDFAYDPNESLDEAEAIAEDDDAGDDFTDDDTDDELTAGAPSDDTGNALVQTGASMLASDDMGQAPSDIGDDDIDHRPVPRISIHAFCESPATTALLEKAAVDRRLNKAHLTMHMGGIAKAVDQFQTASTPNLIILETTVGGSEIFAQLGELAEVCDPSTKVVIIGQVNDIILYRELMRQGISEYIVRPNSPLQIIKAIADLYVDPSAPPIGRTIAFVGARGGVGSSSIAHNVGWCAAEEFTSDTVILDLDLPFGTASLDFDQEASAGLVEALSSPERLDDVLLDRLLQKHTEHLSLFTAPSILDRDYEIDDQAFETVIDVVRGAAPTIIVDVPHMWTSWSKRILTTADEIVITATPDLAAFRNTKNLVDILNNARPNDAAPTLVINQHDPKLSAVQPDQFEEHVGLKPSAVIGFEPQLFGAAATNAEPIFDVGPKTKTAQTLRELSAVLLGRGEAEIIKPKFSLAGLFKGKR